MRYSAVFAALVSVVAATTTTYVTVIDTITSCAPTVTNCPARSTSTRTTSYPVVLTTGPVTPTETAYYTVVNTITKCPATVTNCPVGKLTTTLIPKPTNGTSYVKPTLSTSVPVPISSKAPVSSPFVVTVTVNACPATSSPATTSAVPTLYKNVTASVTTPSPSKFTGAASTMSGSIVVAGLGALAAVFFA